MVYHICLCSPAERTPCISLTVSHYRSIWAPQASASVGKTLKHHSRARSHTDLNINCHSSGQKRCMLSRPLRCLVEMQLRRGVSGDTHRWERMRKGEEWGRRSESRACETAPLWAWFQIQIALKVKMIPSHLKTAALFTLQALRDSAPPCALCDLSPRAGIIISEWLIKNNWGPERLLHSSRSEDYINGRAGNKTQVSVHLLLHSLKPIK